ncbi:GIY-YIG nuclease family protein [Lacibacterium aquatile]
MKGEERQAAVADYKERKSAGAGIYAVRCPNTGEVWVGRAPNVDAIRNRIWFSLRQGAAKPASLQAAWNRNGEGGLTLDILERIDPEELSPQRRLKDRLAFWAAELRAEVV